MYLWEPYSWGRGFGEKEMLPAINTRGGRQGGVRLSPLPRDPGSACPVSGGRGWTRRPFVFPSQAGPALAGAPAGLRGGERPRGVPPPFAPQPAGSSGGLSSASSALFLPLSLPLARSRLSRRLISPERTKKKKKSISEHFRFYGKVHFCLIPGKEEACGAHHLSTWSSPLC